MVFHMVYMPFEMLPSDLWPVIEIRLKRDESVIILDREEDPILVTNGKYIELGFRVPCEEQGVFVNYARFEKNRARNGGAVSSVRRHSAAVTLKHAFFDGNSATGSSGGAISVSGSYSRLDIEDSEFFENSAGSSDVVDTSPRTLSIPGSGGAVSVQYGAGLRMTRVTARRDQATGGGDGGFVFANFADQVLLRDVTIHEATALSGGGGALTVFAGRVALDNVTVQACEAGLRGGGALMLDGHADAHLFGCTFQDNECAGSGGHVAVRASKLIVHASDSSLVLPASEPMFPDTVILGQVAYVPLREGPGCEAAGHEDIVSAEDCLRGALLLGFDNITSNSAHKARYEELMSDTWNPNRRDDDTFLRPRMRMCSVKLVIQSSVETHMVFFEKNSGLPVCKRDRPNKETQAKCLRPCTPKTPCICRKTRTASVASSKTTLMKGGRVSESSSGGAVFCSASVSPLGQQKQVFRTAADVTCGEKAMWMTPSPTSPPELICFGKGAWYGNGTEISSSSADQGGGVAAVLCDLAFQGTVLRNNEARSGSGGGVHLSFGARMAVSAGMLSEHNAAADNGGAVACESCEAITFAEPSSGGTKYRFVENSARNGSGGALRIESIVFPDGVKSYSSVFWGNRAHKDGGAVSMSSQVQELHGVGKKSYWYSIGDAFLSNTASRGSGGAIATEGVVVNLDEQSVCRENSAPRGGGGCLFWDARAASSMSPRWDEFAPPSPPHQSKTGFVDKSNTALFQTDFGLATPPRHFVFEMGSANPFIMKAADAVRGPGEFDAGRQLPPRLGLRDKHGSTVRITERTAGMLVGVIPGVMAASKRVHADLRYSLYGGINAIRRINETSKDVYYDFGGESGLKMRGKPLSGPFEVELTAETATEEFRRSISAGGQAESAVLRMSIGQCEKGFMNSETGECQGCPKNTISSRGRCMCSSEAGEAGFYNASSIKSCGPNNPEECCAKCPDGADCSADHSLEVHELTARPGYWRQNRLLDIFVPCQDAYTGTLLYARKLAEERCCPIVGNISVCQSHGGKKGSTRTTNVSSSCQVGYTGVLCRGCDISDGFVPVGDGCVHCPSRNGTGPWVPMLFSIGLSLLIFVIFMVLYMKAKPAEEEGDREHEERSSPSNAEKNGKKEKTDEEKITKNLGKSTAVRFVTDQALIGRLEGNSRGNANGETMMQSDVQVLVGRIKIVWDWVQCFGALTTVFDSVPWPSTFKSFSMHVGDAFNFDLSALLGYSSCRLAVPFLDQFLVHMMFPFFVLVAIMLARLPAHFKNKSPALRQKQHELMVKNGTAVVLLMYPVSGLCGLRVFS